MRLAKFIFTFFLLTGFFSNTSAQLASAVPITRDIGHYTDFSAIYYEGQSLVQEDSPEGPLLIPAVAENGVFKVMAVDKSGESWKPLKPIGFRIAIKNFRTGSMWMYSEETLYEANLQEVLKKCEKSDQLIFMTVDPKYRLPRHEVTLNGGC